jgi:4'-phosphopantetheinyl transferase
MGSALAFATTGKAPCLAADEAHVWRLDLRTIPEAIELQALSAAERVRAARFVFARDRERFVSAHCAVRRILAAYLGADPRALEFVEGVNGKPALAAGGPAFNLSHSGDHGLLAVSPRAEIGADIETLDAPRDMRALAARLFTQDECRSLETIADDALAVPFLTCWTRKEAFLKALGAGLTLEPRGFDVGTSTAARLVMAPPEYDGGAVHVTSLFADSLGVGALAVRGEAVRTRLLDARIDLR